MKKVICSVVLFLSFISLSFGFPPKVIHHPKPPVVQIHQTPPPYVHPLVKPTIKPPSNRIDNYYQFYMKQCYYPQYIYYWYDFNFAFWYMW